MGDVMVDVKNNESLQYTRKQVSLARTFRYRKNRGKKEKKEKNRDLKMFNS